MGTVILIVTFVDFCSCSGLYVDGMCGFWEFMCHGYTRLRGSLINVTVEVFVTLTNQKLSTLKV